MQQKLKEEREAKRAQLDGRHDYILSIVASCLGLEKSDVEDAILEGNQVLELNFQVNFLIVLGENNSNLQKTKNIEYIILKRNQVKTLNHFFLCSIFTCCLGHCRSTKELGKTTISSQEVHLKLFMISNE